MLTLLTLAEDNPVAVIEFKDELDGDFDRLVWRNLLRLVHPFTESLCNLGLFSRDEITINKALHFSRETTPSIVFPIVKMISTKQQQNPENVDKLLEIYFSSIKNPEIPQDKLNLMVGTTENPINEDVLVQIAAAADTYLSNPRVRRLSHTILAEVGGNKIAQLEGVLRTPNKTPSKAHTITVQGVVDLLSFKGRKLSIITNSGQIDANYVSNEEFGTICPYFCSRKICQIELKENGMDASHPLSTEHEFPTAVVGK